MYNELNGLVKRINEIIDNYDDDEIVAIISELYMMVFELISSSNILTIENKLLQRELNQIYEENGLEELKEKVGKNDGEMYS
jgi:hypothetical protein